MKLVVLVPAYNAARHLPEVIARIAAARPPHLFRIVIVDDGSTDGTAAVAQDLARAAGDIEVVGSTAQRRLRRCHEDGLQVARTLDAERAASVHADGQYSPEALTDLLAALDSRGLDLLQGSRIAGGQALAGGMPLYKIRRKLGDGETRTLGLRAAHDRPAQRLSGLRPARPRRDSVFGV